LLKIKISVDLSGLQKFDLYSPAQLDRAIRAATGAYMERQRDLVNKGLDIHGKPFAPYDPPATKRGSYADKKSRAGRMQSNYWLRLTGQMWRHQRVRYRKGKGFRQSIISFEGMQSQARFSSPRRRRKGMSNDALVVRMNKGDKIPSAFVAWMCHRKRPFVGFSWKTYEIVTRAFKKALKT